MATPANKIETCEGRLLTFFGEWKVQTRYGTFPLAPQLQSRPQPEHQSAWVAVTTQHGMVIDYHFADDPDERRIPQPGDAKE